VKLISSQKTNNDSTINAMDSIDKIVNKANEKLFEEKKLNLIHKRKDSLLLKQYELKIKEEYEITDGDNSYISSVVKYSPDNIFKIFSFEIETCGGNYCHESHKTWIHYNYLRKEYICELETKAIDTIYKMPDNKYLILDFGSDRPQSSITESYKSAYLLWFKNDSIIALQFLEIIQTNMVDNDDLDEFIIYNSKNRTLTYKYSSYPNDLLGVMDGDTLSTYEGVLKYKKGEFIVQNEKITNRVNNKIIK